jgi:hypothetical protein
MTTVSPWLQAKRRNAIRVQRFEEVARRTHPFNVIGGKRGSSTRGSPAAKSQRLLICLNNRLGTNRRCQN